MPGPCLLVEPKRASQGILKGILSHGFLRQ
jgi:hypothetical protein